MGRTKSIPNCSCCGAAAGEKGPCCLDATTEIEITISGYAPDPVYTDITDHAMGWENHDAGCDECYNLNGTFTLKAPLPGGESGATLDTSLNTNHGGRWVHYFQDGSSTPPVCCPNPWFPSHIICQNQIYLDVECGISAEHYAGTYEYLQGCSTGQWPYVRVVLGWAPNSALGWGGSSWNAAAMVSCCTCGSSLDDGTQECYAPCKTCFFPSLATILNQNFKMQNLVTGEYEHDVRNYDWGQVSPPPCDWRNVNVDSIVLVPDP